MVVVDSRRVPRVPRYSGTCHEPHRFRLRGYHPVSPVLPDCSANGSVGNSPALNRAGPTTPMDPKTHRFGLFRVRSPLLTESLICFLFLRVLRWFTSLGLLRHPMYSDGDVRYSYLTGSPIRKSPDHRMLASPRGLSQLATSFIVCWRQGIHTHALSSLTIK